MASEWYDEPDEPGDNADDYFGEHPEPDFGDSENEFDEIVGRQEKDPGLTAVPAEFQMPARCMVFTDIRSDQVVGVVAILEDDEDADSTEVEMNAYDHFCKQQKDLDPEFTISDFKYVILPLMSPDRE